MSAENSMEQHKKLLEDALNAHDKNEEPYKQIEAVLKLLKHTLEMIKKNNPESLGKILEIEEMIVVCESMLKADKDFTEKMVVITKELEETKSKLRIVKSELERYKKLNNDFFSKQASVAPSASIINHPLNIPPPQAPMFVETVEPPKPGPVTQNQLSDLEKQMQAMANEILRWKELSDNDENFNNGKKEP